MHGIGTNDLSLVGGVPEEEAAASRVLAEVWASTCSEMVDDVDAAS